MKTGRPPKWHSPTTVIRVPDAYAQSLLALAHQWEKNPADRELRNLANTIRCQRQREAVLIEEINTLKAQMESSETIKGGT